MLPEKPVGTPNLIKGPGILFTVGERKPGPGTWGQGDYGHTPFHPLQPDRAPFLLEVLHLHALWSERRLGHLVPILHQLVELAVHQDARVGVQPCKGQDHTVLSAPLPFPTPHTLARLRLLLVFTLCQALRRAQALGSREPSPSLIPPHSSSPGFAVRGGERRTLQGFTQGPVPRAPELGAASSRVCTFQTRDNSILGSSNSTSRQSSPEGMLVAMEGLPSPHRNCNTGFKMLCLSIHTSPCSALGTKHL